MHAGGRRAPSLGTEGVLADPWYTSSCRNDSPLSSACYRALRCVGWGGQAASGPHQTS